MSDRDAAEIGKERAQKKGFGGKVFVAGLEKGYEMRGGHLGRFVDKDGWKIKAGPKLIPGDPQSIAKFSAYV